MIAPRRRPAAVLLLLLAVTALAALAGIAHSARLPDRGAGAIVVDAAEAAAATVVDAAAAASSSSSPHQQNRKKHRRRRKPKNPYSSPLGLFIQERASKMLPGPGQHFSFGALRPWEDVAALLEEKPASERKLLLLIRHGQAVSNFLGDALGPDEWFRVEGTCRYDPKNGTEPLDVFDADLTSLGREQASALNSMLRGGGWWPRLTGGYPVRAVVSPLTRCLNTATLALEGLSRSAGGIRATVVEEFVRETLGEDTCDARRSASDPSPAAAAQAAAAGAGSSSSASSGSASSDSSSASIKGPCEFDKGLRTLFPSYKFDVVGEEDKNKQSNRTRAVGRGHRGDDEDDDQDEDDPTPRPFGLISDADTLWTKDAREQQKHQVKRARAFLDILFAHAQDERVAVVVTHSGFARSLLLAVEREPYRPMNAELVPVIVDRAVDEEEEELVEGEEERGGAAAAAAGVGPAAARR